MPRSRSFLIIGAGIAGATLARALAERGAQVQVLEQATVASGASGNRVGVLFPQTTKRWQASSAFYFAGYDLMLRQLRRWQREGLDFTFASPGMLRLPRDAAEEALLAAIPGTIGIDPVILRWLNRLEASHVAGAAMPFGGLWFPEGSYVSPRELCRALLQHPHIMLREQCRVHALTRAGGQWVATLADGETLSATDCALAAGPEAARLLPSGVLPLHAVGGQVSEITIPAGAAVPKAILCRKGYAIPLGHEMLIGATYHRDALEEVTPARHAENLLELTSTLAGYDTATVLRGRSSVRATTPSRLPYIGTLEAGLHVSLGHGSRGLLSAPLAAEMIARACFGEAPPLAPWVAAALRLARS